MMLPHHALLKQLNAIKLYPKFGVAQSQCEIMILHCRRRNAVTSLHWFYVFLQNNSLATKNRITIT